MPARLPPGARRRLVTLSTDLGAAYAAQMKAVLAHDLPPGNVVDLAHDLSAHHVQEASFVVRAMAERFPAGSVHVVVVDPGVGGARAPVVVACRDGSALVGPDNGVLAPLAEALGGGTAFRIEPARLGGRPRIGTTFDGRDVFAPAAARLARGAAPEELGPPTALTSLARPCPQPCPGGARGAVAHVDRFGNAVTDVPTAWVPAGTSEVGVRWGRRSRRVPFVTSYEQAGRGHVAVLGSSFGSLEVAIAEGRAARRLGLRVGSRLTFLWQPPRRRPARRNR